jgi:hypothetical protein
MPQTEGAAWLYHQVIAPYLARYEPVIDEQIDSAKRNATLNLKKLANEGVKTLQRQSQTILLQGQSILSNLNSGAAAADEAGAGNPGGAAAAVNSAAQPQTFATTTRRPSQTGGR